jgi:Protein of unknown function (DUF5818)
MRRVYLMFAAMLFVTACWGQEHQQASVSSGSRTITGCVAIGSPGYVLKTDDGSTLQLRAGTDLGAYMGKRVEIQTSWTQSGVSVAAPDDVTGVTSGAAGAGGGTAATGKEFAGDLHLRFKGKVLGDCLAKK